MCEAQECTVIRKVLIFMQFLQLILPLPSSSHLLSTPLPTYKHHPMSPNSYLPLVPPLLENTNPSIILWCQKICTEFDNDNKEGSKIPCSQQLPSNNRPPHSKNRSPSSQPESIDPGATIDTPPATINAPLP